LAGDVKATLGALFVNLVTLASIRRTVPGDVGDYIVLACALAA
jgi:hypothetical protein